MGRVFAMADLHLSLSGDKPMDVFGELWRDHTARMAERWDATVAPEDSVLLPGDLSWARTLADAGRDLAWIGERPGRKLLLKGNHDSWCSSPGKARAALPPGCELLHQDAHRVEGWVVIGARGWNAPNYPDTTAADEKIFRRELERLRLSIVHADREFGRELPRLAMAHYPPLLGGCGASAVVDVLKRAGVVTCVYGHLHGDDHRLAVQGPRDGITYHFIAADAVNFTPAELSPPGAAKRP